MELSGVQIAGSAYVTEDFAVQGKFSGKSIEMEETLLANNVLTIDTVNANNVNSNILVSDKNYSNVINSISISANTITINKIISGNGEIQYSSSNTAWQLKNNTQFYNILTTNNIIDSVSSTSLVNTVSANTANTLNNSIEYIRNNLGTSVAISVISANTNANVSSRYVMNAAPIVLTFPASANTNDFIYVTNATAYTNNSINCNSKKIMGVQENMTINKKNVSLSFCYINDYLGWWIV